MNKNIIAAMFLLTLLAAPLAIMAADAEGVAIKGTTVYWFGFDRADTKLPCNDNSSTPVHDEKGIYTLAPDIAAADAYVLGLKDFSGGRHISSAGIAVSDKTGKLSVATVLVNSQANKAAIGAAAADVRISLAANTIVSLAGVPYVFDSRSITGEDNKPYDPDLIDAPRQFDPTIILTGEQSAAVDKLGSIVMAFAAGDPDAVLELSQDATVAVNVTPGSVSGVPYFVYIDGEQAGIIGKATVAGGSSFSVQTGKIYPVIALVFVNDGTAAVIEESDDLGTMAALLLQDDEDGNCFIATARR